MKKGEGMKCEDIWTRLEVVTLVYHIKYLRILMRELGALEVIH